MRYYLKPVDPTAFTQSPIAPTGFTFSEITLGGASPTSIEVVSAAAQVTELHPSAVAQLSAGTPGVIPDNYKPNEDFWKKEDELDWIVIDPEHREFGREMRSFAQFQILSTLYPETNLTSFPLDPSSGVGNGGGGNYGSVARVDFFALGGAGYYVTADDLPPANVNFEEHRGGFVVAYQGDAVFGPSEKILINVYRLRLLGVREFKIIFSGFPADSASAGLKISTTLKLYSKGYPMKTSPDPITGENYWQMVDSTTLLDEVLDYFVVQPTLSTALTINVDLVKRTLKYTYTHG